MNRLNFNQTGGFPLSTNILDAMQAAYSVFNSLGELAGNFAIISGCVVSGSNVTNGVVYINGEVLEFIGGGISTNVIIKEETESRVFEDGSTKPVIAKRYATFGSSTPDKTFAWANFKRVFPTTQIEQFRADFEARIKKLESAKFPIPVGMIAIWNKPADVPIPEGWRECTDLRGRVPAGWNPDDVDFATIGDNLGDKTHTLTIQEIPRHKHSTGIWNKFTAKGSDAAYYQSGSLTAGSHDNGNLTGEQVVGSMTSQMWLDSTEKEIGGDMAHNNIQPTRIVRFIEFIGI